MLLIYCVEDINNYKLIKILVKMSLDYLTLDIKYDVGRCEFEVGGDVNRDGQAGIVENFLATQMGAGVDSRKRNEQETYSIKLRWYPQNDMFKVESDTGNNGLRDGILQCFLGSLGE